MAGLMMQARSSCFAQGTPVIARKPMTTRLAAAPVAISARYRGKGTDLGKLGGFKRDDNDTGSPEYQIARLSARVLQLTSHLQTHKKDFATRRGLMSILSQRKQLMLYLQRTNRAEYDRICAELSIRPLKNDL